MSGSTPHQTFRASQSVRRQTKHGEGAARVWQQGAREHTPRMDPPESPPKASSNATGAQRPREHVRIAAGGTGNNGAFAVSWSSWGQDGDAWGSYAALFHESGDLLAPERQLNEHWRGSQGRPELRWCRNSLWAVWLNGTGISCLGPSPPEDCANGPMLRHLSAAWCPSLCGWPAPVVGSRSQAGAPGSLGGRRRGVGSDNFDHWPMRGVAWKRPKARVKGRSGFRSEMDAQASDLQAFPIHEFSIAPTSALGSRTHAQSHHFRSSTGAMQILSIKGSRTCPYALGQRPQTDFLGRILRTPPRRLPDIQAVFVPPRSMAQGLTECRLKPPWKGQPAKQNV